MSSATDVRLPGRHAVVRDYLDAFRDPHTYNLFHNRTALFGFVWGIPVPVFSLGLDLLLSHPTSLGRCLEEHPMHIFFLFHPFLFAFVFGAFGTVRRRMDRRIVHLVGELERSVAGLAQANDRLKELDQLKAQFIANVTHELKTPLVAIRGYNESILELRFGPLTPKQQGGLEVSVRNIDRLQKLIEELLDFERIEAGALKLEIADFDLIPAAEAALDSIRPAIESKRIAAERRLPGSLRVRGDRDRIVHVLLNLLSNAVKFTPEGGTLGIEATEEGGRARIAVWDRGAGIPEAAQKFLFTRFWQADGGSRRRHGGTGLGLAIVKGILDAHGAPIRIQSAEGAGTRAEFELPLSVPVEAVKEGMV
ncbi:MAG TPA: HAMP domain-containing sensor histidine kinase [Planctomycetota bacterium]|nr:HAMP domain-containing sensor histidine kinase [Planctomycetota bacterium]